MKIGLITFYKDNYGSFLQAFSTKYFLEKQGYEVTLIDVVEYGWKMKFLKRIRSITKCIFYPDYLKSRLAIRKGLRKQGLDQQIADQINSLENDLLNPLFITWKEAKLIGRNSEYVAFIAGSDQVWNPSLSMMPHFFLQFAPSRKRIAWAISLGVSEVPNYNKKALMKGANSFKYLSIRERTGQALLKDLLGRNIENVPDPTLLLDQDAWEEITNRFGSEYTIVKPYCLVHFLNEPNELAIKTIRYLETTGLQPLIFSSNFQILKDIPNAVFISGNPADYVRLISQGGCVITDSFHTTLFSINMKTSFLVFKRQYTHGYSQNSRITDLLKKFNLEEHFITSFEQAKEVARKPIDNLESILQQESEKGKKYLLECLRLIEKEV